MRPTSAAPSHWPVSTIHTVGRKAGPGKQLRYIMVFVAARFNLVNYCSELQKRKSHPTGVGDGELCMCSHQPVALFSGSLLPLVSSALPLICSSRSLILSQSPPPPNNFTSPSVFPSLSQLKIQRTFFFFFPCSSSNNDKQMLVVFALHNFPRKISGGPSPCEPEAGVGAHPQRGLQTWAGFGVRRSPNIWEVERVRRVWGCVSDRSCGVCEGNLTASAAWPRGVPGARESSLSNL